MTLDLPEAFLDEVAERAAALVLERLGDTRQASPYLSVVEAAEYMRCSPQRVYDLLSARRLSKLKDGSRVLLLRAEVDEYVTRGVAPRVAPRVAPSTQIRTTAGVAA